MGEGGAREARSPVPPLFLTGQVSGGGALEERPEEEDWLLIGVEKESDPPLSGPVQHQALGRVVGQV